MTDLNELLIDFKDKRLAYKEINRAAHEALLDGIVAEIEALKAVANPPRMAPLPQETVEALALAGPGGIVWVDKDQRPLPPEPAKRGPGRPPKPSEALNG